MKPFHSLLQLTRLTALLAIFGSLTTVRAQDGGDPPPKPSLPKTMNTEEDQRSAQAAAHKKRDTR